jgi:hypothetical protein
MKKIDLGQMISILANVGVIAGIIFLGYEIRQNNAELAAQARYNYYTGRVAFRTGFATEPEIADLTFRALAGQEPLTPVEQARLNNWIIGIFTFWEYEFTEYERGRITEAEYNIADKRAFLQALMPIAGPAYSQFMSTAHPRFAAFMEQRFARGE